MLTPDDVFEVLTVSEAAAACGITYSAAYQWPENKGALVPPKYLVKISRAMLEKYRMEAERFKNLENHLTAEGRALQKAKRILKEERR